MTYDSLSKKRTMTDPDMGYWTYEYDKSGNLKKQTDPNNPTQGIVFNYDGLNRLTEKVYPDRTVTFTYDDPTVPYSKGKLTKVSDPSGGELKEDRVLEFDLLQRVKINQKTIPGRSPVIFEKAYDSAGRVLSITYPGNRTYSYEYDVAGNLLHLKDNATQNNVVAHSNFTALGQPRQANFSNSVITTYDYYPDTGRLHTLLTQKPGTPAYQNLTYQYDQKGNISTLTDSVNNITHNYTYDSLDRLTQANGGGAYPTQIYTYDRIGNIKTKSDVENGSTYNYEYGNKPHAVRSVGNITLQYDSNGNMTQKVAGGVTTIIGWNYDNKPTSITKGSTTVSFTYDGNGQRVKKQSSVSGTTFYFGELYEFRGVVEVLHLFAGNRRVVSVRSDGKNQFYHPNHLGSASIITDQSGDWKEKIEYFPFGSYREDIKNPADPTFPDVNYTFTDQEDDDELGLYNYGARLYDPVLGRFISPDRLVPDPGDPQALNRYTYCLNNPLIYTDPSGEIFGIEFFWVYFAIAVATGAFVGAAQADTSGGNILKGALIGAVIAAVSMFASYGVTWALYPEVYMAHIAAALTPSTRIAAAAVGGFTAGAVSGGINAAVYGGNVWQSALYGGLIGAAIAGTIAGAIELNNWANSGTSFSASKGEDIPENMVANSSGRIDPTQREWREKWVELALKDVGKSRGHCDLYYEGSLERVGKDVSVRASSGPVKGFSHQLSASEKPLDADLVWFKGKHVAGYYNNPNDPSHAYVIHSQGLGGQVKVIRLDFLARERGVEVFIYRVR